MDVNIEGFFLWSSRKDEVQVSIIILVLHKQNPKSEEFWYGSSTYGSCVVFGEN
jgi:hypothetical protein